MATVTSVNVGAVREVPWEGRTFRTAIFKEPVHGRRRIADDHLEGDHVGNPAVHGGALKALYAYATEDYEWWASELATRLAPGTFGENLTTAGLDVTGAVVGERWQVGDAVVRVVQPRIPCAKLGLRMQDRRFPTRFAAARRPGAYLAIERAGTVAAGDRVTVLDRPDHDVTIATIATAYHHDRSLAPRLLRTADVPAEWQDWARSVLADAG